MTGWDQISGFWRFKLRQLSKKYQVPLDSVETPIDRWDKQNPKQSYEMVKDHIQIVSPRRYELEATVMYRDYLREIREREGKEIRKVEKKIRKVHVIEVKKGKKHYPFKIYVNGKILSYSPTRKHAVEIKKDFINKIKTYNKHQRDKLFIPEIQIRKNSGFKKLRF